MTETDEEIQLETKSSFDSLCQTEEAIHITNQKTPNLNLFQKYLSIWVLLAMTLGIILGFFVPAIPTALSKATVSEISIPIAILLWGIILPMMIQIDFKKISNFQPKPIILTSFINYAVQPFTMYALSLLFFRVIFYSYLGQEKANGYLIGCILLGGAPCTAMVFVWSMLMKGDPVYTVSQVLINDILLLILYSPTVKLLAGASDIPMPWETLLLSVALFVLVPLILGLLIRYSLTMNEKSTKFLNEQLLPWLDKMSMVFLLLMIVLIFTSQASTLVHHLVDILIIALPLVLQTFLIWIIAYYAAYLLKIPFQQAGPGSLIACSNFFEMAVAVSVSLYGPDSESVLATVVGVLIEVPLMLSLVWICNRTSRYFTQVNL